LSESLEQQRRRLLYRCAHTGTKETDLLLGAFARRYVPQFDAGQLARFEDLFLSNGDDRLLAWAVGREPVPAAFDNDVMNLLMNFKIHR
jgi:succinate dehydrogenase flavin-adding protein (antitoxin of CptAB toxin-antitoxin module)